MVNLKIIREQHGKLQKDVAADIGIGLSTFSQYETGKREPDNKTLIKLADYFGCSTDYLLGRTDDPRLVIKKAPPESGADEFERMSDAPDKLTPEEIKAVRAFLENQKK